MGGGGLEEGRLLNRWFLTIKIKRKVTNGDYILKKYMNTVKKKIKYIMEK